jgi:hypothetical protein
MIKCFASGSVSGSCAKAPFFACDNAESLEGPGSADLDHDGLAWYRQDQREEEWHRLSQE